MPIGAIAGIGSSIVGGIMGANAAHNAAKAQQEAAKAAADYIKGNAKQATDFQNTEWTGQQANEQPFLQAGQGAVTSLADLMKPGGELFQNWDKTFTAPTDVTEQNDPGFQFRLKEGTDALRNAASATGTLGSGATDAALLKYGQDYGSNEYQNVYNRAFGQYQQGYNEFQQNQANKYNRLMGLTGVGQNAAGQLGQEGSAAAGNMSNILLNSANGVASQLNSQGAAKASGIMGANNAWQGMIGGLTSMAGMMRPQDSPPNMIPGADNSWMLNNASSYGYS